MQIPKNVSEFQENTMTSKKWELTPTIIQCLKCSEIGPLEIILKKKRLNGAGNLLTDVYKIPKDKLYVTVFEGDTKENLNFDQESYDYWKKYIAEDRILKGNKKDNFWEMGDTGPCGPCSEIHVDLRQTLKSKEN